MSNLAKEGILLDQYYAVTHPSEPNYLATIGGDFWGLPDDDEYHIPPKRVIVTYQFFYPSFDRPVVSPPLLISWRKRISPGHLTRKICPLTATKDSSELQPFYTDDYLSRSCSCQQYSYSSVNYLDTSQPPYTFWVRKHDPLIVYDSVASVDSRRTRIRNFNDFAVDVNASALPQWMFVTPNMVDDGHDTTIDFAGDWVDFWLAPLLNDTNFNDNRTLILLTFDETEMYNINNHIFALLLGGAIPDGARGTVDSTYYTHYSSLSTVEANWGLGSLGRGDTNKYVSFPQIAQA